MSVSEHELNISNKSYTNKDFEAIYTELLEVATKLSNRYNPTASNESDPFIVLLKLTAFAADKINYNVDKNILERFILSCTQERSMQELTEMLGYKMHYYISAQTNIVLKYNDSYENADGELSDIQIPKFSKVMTSDPKNPIQYITIEDGTISQNTKISAEIPVMQGVLKTLTMLDSSVITLDNLDTQNRLYFPERMVAENGVFIEGGNIKDSKWLSVYNLNAQPYGSAIFKFAYDSAKKLPYIEFPDWISNIIGNGLSINYVISDGLSGNINAKELSIITRLNPSDHQSMDEKNIAVSNASGASNGADPETIDQTYQGYHKIIGTFDTLVSCRDYANAIYNLLDDRTGQPYVSNVQVADRRTDINYSNQVSTFNQQPQVISMPSDEIQAQEICLYPLKPLIDSSLKSLTEREGGYKDSFNFLKDQSVIKSLIDDTKCIDHDYKTLKGATEDQLGDIVGIRNYCKLECVVSTVAKVTALEEVDIIRNISEALAQKYSPRNLEYGEELAFDDLVDTIEHADIRIKSVSLQEPIQTPKIAYLDAYKNTQECDLHDNSGNLNLDDYFKIIIAKNLLSGKINVFDYNHDFEYDYENKNMNVTDNIKFLKSETCIAPLTTSGDVGSIGTAQYTLLNNEALEFISPKLKSATTYNYGIRYRASLTNADKKIPKNSDYMLLANESVMFEYTNSFDEQIVKTYTAGSIISPTFDLIDSDEFANNGHTPSKVEINNTVIDMFVIGTGNSISIKESVSEILKTPVYCYWILNNPSNKLEFDSTTRSYILKAGEYFFYSDIAKTALFSFGPGTQLTLSNESLGLEWYLDKVIDLEAIEKDGLDSVSDYFLYRKFEDGDAGCKLTIVPHEILTLVYNDTIKIEGITGTTWEISDNEFNEILGSLKYSYRLANSESNDFIPLPQKSAAPWLSRALLDINAGPGIGQKLVGNQQVFYASDDSGSSWTLLAQAVIEGQEEENKKDYFQLDMLVQTNGSNLIDVRYAKNILAPSIIKALTYHYDDLGLFKSSADQYNIDFRTENYYELNIPNLPSTSGSSSYKDRYMMLDLSNVSSEASITLSTLGPNLEHYNSLELSYRPKDSFDDWSTAKNRAYEKRMSRQTEKPADWDPAYNIYYNQNKSFVTNEDSNWNTIKDNIYAKELSYIKWTADSAPADWRVHFNNYYNKNMQFGSATTSEWATNTFYAENVWISQANSISYDPDWSTRCYISIVIDGNINKIQNPNIAITSATWNDYKSFLYKLIPAYSPIAIGVKPVDWTSSSVRYFVQEDSGKPLGYYLNSESNWNLVSGLIYSRSGSQEPYTYTKIETQPANWNTSYMTYYIYCQPHDLHFRSVAQGESWNPNILYYELNLENQESAFTLLATKPSDWEENWSNYFTKINIYSPNITEDWEIVKNNIYQYSYEKLTACPTLWESEYSMYHNEITSYSLNVEPDWLKIGYNVYTQAYVFIGGTLQPPADWESAEGKYYILGNDPRSSLTFISSGLIIIRVIGNCTSIKIQGDGDNKNLISVILEKIKVVNSVNNLLGLTDTSGDILEFIRTKYPEQFKKWYLTGAIDSDRAIEVSESYPLDSAQAFYDKNNIANRWTLPIIDFINSNIRVARSSRK